MGVIQGKLGSVSRMSGSATTFTDEAMTKNADYTRYKITDYTKRFWDDGSALTVKKNGGAITTGFNVEYPGGELLFSPALIVTDVITVSGKYFTPVQCATFFEWKADVSADMKDVTTFASNGWEEQIPIKKNFSASAEGYWADATFLGLLGTRVAISLFVDTVGKDRYEGYVNFKKNSITQPSDDVVKESIDFQGTGQLYWHEY